MLKYSFRKNTQKKIIFFSSLNEPQILFFNIEKIIHLKLNKSQKDPNTLNIHLKKNERF